MKRIIAITVLVFSVLTVVAQESQMRKVPKQISLDLGYRGVVKSEFDNQAVHGYTVLFDYGWQLSGLNGTRSGYITIPLGYTQLFNVDEENSSVRIISYGWTTRHELRPQNGLVPYFGYGLLLSQYAESDKEGRIFGHQTRFSFGLNFYGTSKFVPFAQVDYSMTNYPKWGEKGSTTHNFVEARIGIRYLR